MFLLYSLYMFIIVIFVIIFLYFSNIRSESPDYGIYNDYVISEQWCKSLNLKQDQIQQLGGILMSSTANHGGEEYFPHGVYAKRIVALFFFGVGAMTNPNHLVQLYVYILIYLFFY